MERRWAQQLTYSYYEYNGAGEKCQNPHCPAIGIQHIFVFRHILSGDTIHLGEQCYGRWRDVMGFPRSPKYQDYLDALKELTIERGRLSPAELVKLKREQDEKWLKKEAEEGKLAPKDIPIYWDKLLRRRCMKAWYQKQVKEGQLKLERFYQPMRNFRTVDEACNWAEEHGGYWIGVSTWQGESCWKMYINPHYEKGQY